MRRSAEEIQKEMSSQQEKTPKREESDVKDQITPGQDFGIGISKRRTEVELKKDLSSQQPGTGV